MGSYKGGLLLRITAQEIRVLKLVSQGLSNKEIAENLGLSPSTVKRHIENILKKLRLRNRVEAAVYAARSPVLLASLERTSRGRSGPG